ncbi:MAG: DUF3307 domain-containing protein [Rhodobacteraceae bacterium]|nr:DUF3307 domain-containing protein [Paracoccaceae bacterium]
MIATTTALFCAHILADFAFQSAKMAEAKAARHGGALAQHWALVLATLVICTGQISWLLLGLSGVHMLIDLAKTYAPKHRLWSFTADQSAHLLSLMITALIAPTLWASGLWQAELPAPVEALLLQAGLIIGGLVFATRAGSFAVALLMQEQTANAAASKNEAASEPGLPGGGMLIGILERGLIYLLILAGQPAAIGYLIAAKSILRFGAVNENRAASEYVIIGTLASFGWAIICGLGISLLRAELPMP